MAFSCVPPPPSPKTLRVYLVYSNPSRCVITRSYCSKLQVGPCWVQVQCDVWYQHIHSPRVDGVCRELYYTRRVQLLPLQTHIQHPELPALLHTVTVPGAFRCQTSSRDELLCCILTFVVFDCQNSHKQ